MTPKKKAEELAWRFKLLHMGNPDAIKCALIVVDELLIVPTAWASEDCVKRNPKIFEDASTEEYWLKVKEFLTNGNILLKGKKA